MNRHSKQISVLSRFLMGGVFILLLISSCRPVHFLPLPGEPKEKYIVTFDTNLPEYIAEPISTRKITAGDTLGEVVPILSDSDDKFILKGWFDDAGNEYTAETPITKNVHLTAEWESVWNGGINTARILEQLSNETIAISSPSELAGLASIVNDGNTLAGKTIELNTDINLNNQEWVPIGLQPKATITHADNKPFSGIFDGNNHRISNLQVTEQSRVSGLFGFTINADFRNVILESVSLKNASEMGALAGRAVYNDGLEHSAANIVADTSITGGSQAGGLIGTYNGNNADCSVSFSNINVTADIKTDDEGYAGGVIGYQASNLGLTEFSKIEVCGNVDSSNGYTTYAGGLIGYAFNDGTLRINDVYNKAEIKAGTTDLTDSGFYGAGGIIGSLESVETANLYIADSLNEGSISTCTSTLSGSAGGLFGIIYNNDAVVDAENKNTGTITGNRAGGLAGFVSTLYSNASLNASSFSNSGTINGEQIGGGIVGYIYAGEGYNINVSIKDALNTGNINISDTVINYAKSGGGLIGILESYSSSIIANISGKNEGAISSPQYAGGIMGYLNLITAINNSVVLDNVENASDSIIGEESFTGTILGCGYDDNKQSTITISNWSSTLAGDAVGSSSYGNITANPEI